MEGQSDTDPSPLPQADEGAALLAALLAAPLQPQAHLAQGMEAEASPGR